MRIARKLKEIGQVMHPMTTQKDLALLLKKSENAQKLDGLVQEIRYAMMDYQVCTPKRPALVAANIRRRLRCNEISTMRAISRL